MKNKFLLIMLSCIVPGVIGWSSSNAQKPVSPHLRISLELNNEPLQNVLSYIEGQSPFRFAYNSTLINQQKNVSIKASELTIKEVLDKIFENSSIVYSITGNQVILQQKLNNKIVISGFTRDKETGELLIGTSIFVPSIRQGVASNSYGYYSLSLKNVDTVDIVVSYAGYRSILYRLGAQKDLNLNFNLAVKNDTSSPITFYRDKRADNVSLNQVDQIDLSADAIAATPTISGNSDVISSLQLSAGVQVGLDGTSGYYVRGGNMDQNQILLDEATLYNPTHLFNLVSIFNSPTIKKANFLKGGFPANYGDFLSSLLDIYVRDGNNQQVGGDLQVGNIASSVALFGPLSANSKTSFLLAGRRSMIDYTLQPFEPSNFFSNYHFYDVNAKLNFDLNSKNRLLFSYYRGSDHNYYVNEGKYNETDEEPDEGKISYKNGFGNQAFNIRWNHLFSKKFFLNTHVIYSNYYQHLSAVQGDYFAQLYSGIRDLSVKSDFYYYPAINHRIRGGVNYLLQSVFPATISNRISSIGFVNINEKDIPEKRSYRFSGYISDDVKVTNRFKVYAGIRFPVFFKPDVVYSDIEPRISFLHLLGQSSSIKLAYSRMHQYIHLIQSYNASFPAEIWIASSKLVKPQASHEFSLGLYKNIRDNMFQTSVEFYYKPMDNQMLFKGITTTSINTDIEDQLIFGKAWSYGSEFIVKKTTGNLKGCMSYTLSKAYQQFDSLNYGKQFSSANNRTHNLYLSLAYDINAHLAFSANLFLTSGKQVTLNAQSAPAAQGDPDDNPLFDEEEGTASSTATEPNNFRLSSYNRLDLGVRYRAVRKGKNRKWESDWSLSVYNVYAHRNTYFAYRSVNPVTMQPFITQVTFIPVIPSLAYHLKF